MTRLKYVRAIRIAVVAVATVGLLMAETPFRHKRNAGILPIVNASGSCSNSSLQGNFGFQFKGDIIGLGPIAGVGVTTYDGAGNFTGKDNINVNGFPVLSLAESGTYSVNADCTGIQTVNQADGNVVHTTFVIMGKQVFQVQTDPGAVVTAVSRPLGAAEED
jgi:hypothetical protein